LATADVFLDLMIGNVSNPDHVFGDRSAKLLKDLIAGEAINQGAVRQADKRRS
jgi:hypothetical protein